jgi:hypothetical protein
MIDADKIPTEKVTIELIDKNVKWKRGFKDYKM